MLKLLDDGDDVHTDFVEKPLCCLLERLPDGFKLAPHRQAHRRKPDQALAAATVIPGRDRDAALDHGRGRLDHSGVVQDEAESGSPVASVPISAGTRW
jgi:hypothetical protein